MVPHRGLSHRHVVGPRRWVGLVINARSGRGRGRTRVSRLIKHLNQSPFDVRVAWTIDDRRAIVARAHADPDACRCLIAVGGDGTIMALLNEQPQVPITVMPAGTENLFACHFGMGARPLEVADLVRDGQVVDLDVGLIDKRERFGLMAGIGFDADVVTRHHRGRTSRDGQVRTTTRAAYVGPILQSCWAYRFPRITARFETGSGRLESLDGAMVFLFNLPRYALALPVAPKARGDDGWLDLVVFRNPGPFQMARYLWMVFRGVHTRRDGITHRRVRRAWIETDQPAPVQLDGDPGGWITPDRPWTIEAHPSAVRVLVPAGFPGIRTSDPVRTRSWNRPTVEPVAVASSAC